MQQSQKYAQTLRNNIVTERVKQKKAILIEKTVSSSSQIIGESSV